MTARHQGHDDVPEAPEGRPDTPQPGVEKDERRTVLHERAPGAHEEQVGDGLFREDDSPPE